MWNNAEGAQRNVGTERPCDAGELNRKRQVRRQHGPRNTDNNHEPLTDCIGSPKRPRNNRSRAAMRAPKSADGTCGRMAWATRACTRGQPTE